MGEDDKNVIKKLIDALITKRQIDIPQIIVYYHCYTYLK
jgi:hypothetical protein